MVSVTGVNEETNTAAAASTCLSGSLFYAILHWTLATKAFMKLLFYSKAFNLSASFSRLTPVLI